MYFFSAHITTSSYVTIYSLLLYFLYIFFSLILFHSRKTNTFAEDFKPTDLREYTNLYLSDRDLQQIKN